MAAEGCVRAGAAEVGARDRYGELNCGKLDLAILLGISRLPTYRSCLMFPQSQRGTPWCTQ